MKKLLIFALLLTGCQQIPITNDDGFPRAVGADNYRFLVKEYENLSPGVEFILMRNEEDRKETMRRVFGRNWKKIAGFTYWNEDKKTCRIVVPDPAWEYKPELIGHEVAHCIWGKFHKGDEGKGPIVGQSSWRLPGASD